MSMIRKYHNHKLQTTLWHRAEEPLNHQETPGRQIKQSNQLSLPHQDDCNTRMDIKQRTTKHRTITDSHNGSNNKQKVNNNRTTAKAVIVPLRCQRGSSNEQPSWNSTNIIFQTIYSLKQKLDGRCQAKEIQIGSRTVLYRYQIRACTS